VGPQARNISLYNLERAGQLSSWFPGFDVAGARDGSWDGHRLALLHLATKLSLMGANVDEQSATYTCIWTVSTEPSDGHCSVPSHCTGRRYFQLPVRGGGYEAPGMGLPMWC
jgi:hypothetical protein